MNKKEFLELILLVVIVSNLIVISNASLLKTTESEMMNVVWEKTFGEVDEDFARSVLETGTGDIVLVANTQNYGAVQNDIMVMKLDSTGKEVWNVTFGTLNDDIPSSIISANDGGFFVTGTSEELGSGNTLGLFAKVSSTGELVWNKTLGTSTNNRIDSITKTSDDGFLLVGVTNSFDSTPNMWLIKTDETGSEQWNKTYGGLSFQRAFDVVSSNDGGFVMAGWTGLHSGVEIANDVWILKTDQNGNELWNISYGDKYYGELAEQLIKTSDGGFLLGAITNSPRISSGVFDVWIIKTDSNGLEEWNKTYGGKGQDYSNALLEESDGGFLVSIHTLSSPYSSGDNMVMKIKNDGTQEWNWTKGYPEEDDFAYDMIPTTDGGYILAGRTMSIGAGGSDIWVLKVAINENTSSPTAPGFSYIILLTGILIITYTKKKR